MDIRVLKIAFCLEKAGKRLRALLLTLISKRGGFTSQALKIAKRIRDNLNKMKISQSPSPVEDVPWNVRTPVP